MNQPDTIAQRGYWTYQDLMKLFNRSYMTIYIWKTKRCLPHLQISAKRVMFPKKSVVDWADSQGIVYRLDALSESPSDNPSPIPIRSGATKSANSPPMG